MTKNIFEGAKFGDKFLCRNGEMAIYLKTFICNGYWHLLSNGKTTFSVKGDGTIEQTLVGCYGKELNIVSRYQEPHGECNNNPNGCISSICPETCSKFIDEDRLNELAENHVKCFDFTIKPLPNERALAKASFKAGYRKAMEG